MNKEFIKKLIQAKKLEMEAFLELVPERARKHLTAAGQEIKAAAAECFTEQKTGEKKRSTVKKVDIG